MIVVTAAPKPTSTVILGVTNTPAPEDDLADRFISIQDDLKKAYQLRQEEKYAEAISVYDHIINVVPEYSMAYFSRASCYYWMGAKDQRFLAETEKYYDKAYAGLQKAFDMGPEGGHLYQLKFLISDSQATLHDYTVYRNFWKEIALSARLKSHEMSWRRPWGNRSLGFELITLDRCEEARDNFLYLQEHTYPEWLPSAGIHTGLAKSFLCLKEYDKAMKHIERAIEIRPSDERVFTRAMILLNAGNLEEALESFNQSISDKPHYGGRRYYLRAVIYYEMGKEDLARADLTTGLRNTWGQAIERAYVLGRMAIDSGEIEQGIQLLQEAEATLLKSDVPRIYEKTVAELERLDAEFLHPTPTPDGFPTPTPVTPLPDQLYITPTPPFKGAPYYQMNYTGSGLRHFGPTKSILFSFRPNQNLEVHRVKSLFVNIDADYPQEAFTLKMDCVDSNGSWGMPESPRIFTPLHIGENEVPDPQSCAPEDGYIYLAIWNDGTEDIVVENISLKLVVIAKDGSEVIYGDG